VFGDSSQHCALTLADQHDWLLSRPVAFIPESGVKNGDFNL
jgi:hypothetical protein